MRRNRRGGSTGLDFGGSGEDSFVAVVVTKLTGALLFILLLTMVIMALLPKAVDLSSGGDNARDSAQALARTVPLSITTPDVLPDAIAGRPYAIALAAVGGRGPLHWNIEGALPAGLTFDAASGVLQGTPAKGTPQPLPLSIRVSDGDSIATGSTRLVVYQSDKPLFTPAWWKPGLPPVPWRAWLDQGVGFLVLWLIHLIGMSTLATLERTALPVTVALKGDNAGSLIVGRRYTMYRNFMRLGTLSAMLVLGVWLWTAR